MTEAQAIEIISANFAAQWPPLSNQVPFALENRRLTSPTSDTFALVTTDHTGSEQRTCGGVGTRFVERQGWITVKLWGPAGAGRLGLGALVEVVHAIYEMKNLGPPIDGETVDTQASTTQKVGEDGRHFMLLVRTPFSYFETK